MGMTTTPREDAYAKADELEVGHPDAWIGVYPMGADEWFVLATLADGSAITSVFTRGPLAPAMLEAARQSGLLAVWGHDRSRLTYRPAEAS
jgi:hypothetical protein